MPEHLCVHGQAFQVSDLPLAFGADLFLQAVYQGASAYQDFITKPQQCHRDVIMQALSLMHLHAKLTSVEVRSYSKS